MGWTYNTTDPDAPTIGPLITGVAVALTFLSLVTVSLRTYVRAFMIRALGIDDWIIIVAWIGSAGFAIITIIQTKWGLGLRHIDDLPAEDIYTFGLLQYMGAPFYITSILGFKLALLFTYLRLVPAGIYRQGLYAVIVACTLFHLSFLLVQLNLCQPARKQWDPTVTWGSCISGVPFYTAMASITIIFDVTVMLLPFPVLLQSRLQTRKKVILLGLFGLGIFITIIQIIRIQTVKQLSNYTDSAPLILWSTVENNLGIMVASVPTLAPLVKYYNERSSRRGGGYYPSGSNTLGGPGNNGATGGTGRGNTTAGTGRGGAGGGAGATIGSAMRSGRRGSRVASQTWQSRSRRSNKMDLETTMDMDMVDIEAELGSMGAASTMHDGTELGSFEGCVSSLGKRGGSMESILDSTRSDSRGEGGITKKVEVIVTRT